MAAAAKSEETRQPHYATALDAIPGPVLLHYTAVRSCITTPEVTRAILF